MHINNYEANKRGPRQKRRQRLRIVNKNTQVNSERIDTPGRMDSTTTAAATNERCSRKYFVCECVSNIKSQLRQAYFTATALRGRTIQIQTHSHTQKDTTNLALVRILNGMNALWLSDNASSEKKTNIQQIFSALYTSLPHLLISMSFFLSPRSSAPLCLCCFYS